MRTITAYRQDGRLAGQGVQYPDGFVLIRWVVPTTRYERVGQPVTQQSVHVVPERQVIEEPVEYETFVNGRKVRRQGTHTREVRKLNRKVMTRQAVQPKIVGVPSLGYSGTAQFPNKAALQRRGFNVVGGY